MANEIRIFSGMEVINDPVNLKNNQRTQRFTQTSKVAAELYQTIGTSEEALAFGDITPTWIQITNLDATNFVDIRFSTGVAGLTIPVGVTVGPFKLKSGASLLGIADTASVDILIRCCED